MPGSRSDWPATPDFHPEFGRLCPSPRRRRGIRLGMVSAVAILVIGATMGLAVAHWPDSAKGDSAKMDLAGQPKEPLPGASAISISSVQRSAPAATSGTSPVARAQESCEPGLISALAAVFLDPSCGSSKLHARHGARATNRVATVIIGRVETPPTPPAATVAVTATEPSKDTASAAQKSIASATPIGERPAQRAKTAKVPSGGSAYASDPRFGHGPYETYGTYRYVAPQSSFDGRFGRSW
jgi:hypothetical protein